MSMFGWGLWITIIGPYFFPENINITAEVYSEFLEETMPNLLENVPLNILPNIIYQQDGHPAHTSILARAIFNRRFLNRWIGCDRTCTNILRNVRFCTSILSY